MTPNWGYYINVQYSIKQFEQQLPMIKPRLSYTDISNQIASIQKVLEKLSSESVTQYKNLHQEIERNHILSVYTKMVEQFNQKQGIYSLCFSKLAQILLQYSLDQVLCAYQTLFDSIYNELNQILLCQVNMSKYKALQNQGKFQQIQQVFFPQQDDLESISTDFKEKERSLTTSTSQQKLEHYEKLDFKKVPLHNRDVLMKDMYFHTKQNINETKSKLTTFELNQNKDVDFINKTLNEREFNVNKNYSGAKEVFRKVSTHQKPVKVYFLTQLHQANYLNISSNQKKLIGGNQIKSNITILQQKQEIESQQSYIDSLKNTSNYLLNILQNCHCNLQNKDIIDNIQGNLNFPDQLQKLELIDKNQVKLQTYNSRNRKLTISKSVYNKDKLNSAIAQSLKTHQIKDNFINTRNN